MAPVTGVHAQEYLSGVTNCVTVVPKSWDAFKGRSEYGIAFGDEKGTQELFTLPRTPAKSLQAADLGPYLELLAALPAQALCEQGQ